jgi:signal transduction histidine kinase
VHVQADGTRVVVEVCDTGVGIAPDQRDRIFLPFFTTKPSGTGLGMSIVKKIVDLHGGEIEVDSAPGHGTRVRIALPAADRLEPTLVGERS